jgi:hypothetical protein
MEHWLVLELTLLWLAQVFQEQLHQQVSKISRFSVAFLVDSADALPELLELNFQCGWA